MTNFTAPGNGISGGYQGASLGMKITIATLAGITWYNAFELMILLFVTFAEYRGLYFWSLLISSSVGLLPYSLGFLLKFFNLTDIRWLPVTLLTIGWWCMVTGQSVVLYSRLHLVLSNHRVLRRVLIMIVVNAVILHLPTTVLTYGTNLAVAPSLEAWKRGYNIMEKLQMTGFCLQEFIISGLYIWETVRMLRLDPDRAKRKIQYQLLIINFIIIILDLGLLVAEYKNYYIMETMLKGAVYSIKLKLEFAVLGKLIHLVHNHVWKPESFSAPRDLPDFVDATRVTSDVTHAPPTVNQRMPSGMDADDISIAMFEHLPPTHMRSNSDSNSWSSEGRAYHVDHAPIDFTNPFQYSRHASRSRKMVEKPC
ncbi:hypothetical protein PENANT_c014G05597 [Penicillium antarcticum]|uniref:DUF7703 domain-containing protein n=1 Tax=Penicillium antarcticum TaxID=416450 RepID=A0A1V6Q440_9EURO|nr:uncharacterized protein N7508_009541 [Penicillium antarcticum]KAJ5294720.1 hypothetical protein N7508_009541 [Penicillium antarcticum]OQD84038.1 hypothetical protein PENANT_c014G05597 [Penicillium antarcticum]